MNSYAGLEAGSYYSINCPNCGEVLEQNAFAGGRKLTRCWHCGGMVRAATRPRPARNGEAGSWGEAGAGSPVSEKTRLELAQSYSYPNLQCPYCEHVNQDSANSNSLYCANCGAELKKDCLHCSKPMYVLDHFCPYCRTDQERAQYELEAFYWQHFNEGKRLARAGQWEECHRHLAIFFEPHAIVTDDQTAQQAQAFYRHSIAPEDGGEGLRIYNESLAKLRRQIDDELKQERWRTLIKWSVVAGVLGLIAVWSALTFGSWWAIFAMGFGALILIGLVILFIIVSIGGM